MNELKAQLEAAFKKAIETVGQGKDASEAVNTVNQEVNTVFAAIETHITESVAQANTASQADAQSLTDAQATIAQQASKIEQLNTTIAERDASIVDLNTQVSDLQSANTTLEQTNIDLKAANDKLSGETDTPPAQIDNNVKDKDLEGEKDDKNKFAWMKAVDKRVEARVAE